MGQKELKQFKLFKIVISSLKNLLFIWNKAILSLLLPLGTLLLSILPPLILLLGANLNQLAKAVNSGSLPVTPATETAIHEAAQDVMEMRRMLIDALGLDAGAP